MVSLGVRVHDPVETEEGHWFALSVAGTAEAEAAAAVPECTLASASETSGAVWRAVVARAAEWFEQPIRTEAEIAPYFPTSLESEVRRRQTVKGGAERWYVQGLLFTDGVFAWRLAPVVVALPPPAKLRLRLAAGTATPDAHSAKRKYRHTPAVRRGSGPPPSDDEDTTVAKKRMTAAATTATIPMTPTTTAESEVLADEYYHEFVAEMERCRQIRVAASRRFLERTQIRRTDVDDLIEAAETP